MAQLVFPASQGDELSNDCWIWLGTIVSVSLAHSASCKIHSNLTGQVRRHDSCDLAESRCIFFLYIHSVDNSRARKSQRFCFVAFVDSRWLQFACFQSIMNVVVAIESKEQA